MNTRLGARLLVVGSLTLVHCGGDDADDTGAGANGAGGDAASGAGDSGSGASASGGAGAEGGAGTGAGGSGGAGGGDATRSYLLWSQPDTAWVWTLSNADGGVISQKTLTLPAEKGTGWTARDLDALRDGSRRLLWTRAEQGEALLWELDEELDFVSETAHHASDPAAGWYATSYAKLADGTGRLVWFNGAVGSAVVWPLAGDDTYAGGQKKVYTPAADLGAWVPTQFSPAPDGTARLLWAFTSTGGTAGQHAVVWHLDPLEDKAVEKPISLDLDWYARGYHVSEDGRVRMAWGEDVSAIALVCGYASDAAATSVPSENGWGDGQCKQFGPEEGWTFRALSSEDCTPGNCAAPCVDDLKLPHLNTPPATLSQTGLFSKDGGVAPYAAPFQPEYVLWSDGANKSRYAYIPTCAKIDNSDPDHWVMPVGARFWKEFERDGVVVETRLIHRYGPGPDDWVFAAYQWTGEDAVHVPGGVQNANGTQHDIPSENQCKTCHGRLVERTLGFSAIQLSHSLPGETMATLSNAGKLTVPNPVGWDPPGNATERAALGYLHANCGNCHNDADPVLDMRLRLLVADTSPEQTGAYKTALGKPTQFFDCLGAGAGTCNRITAGQPKASAVMMRTGSTTPGVRMPPLGTEIVDEQGTANLAAWISGL